MQELERQRNGVGNDLVESRAVSPAKVGRVRPLPVNQKIQKSADARFAGEQVLAGGAAPHCGQLVDGLADADADVLAALVPATGAAHDLPPYGEHAVLPQIIGETHDRIAARVVTVQRQAACH